MRIRDLVRCGTFQGYREEDKDGFDGSGFSNSLSSMQGTTTDNDTTDNSFFDSVSDFFSNTEAETQAHQDAVSASMVNGTSYSSEYQTALQEQLNKQSDIDMLMGLDENRVTTVEEMYSKSFVADDSYSADFSIDYSGVVSSTISMFGVDIMNTNTHYYADGTKYGVVAEAIADFVHGISGYEINPDTMAGVDAVMDAVAPALSGALTIMSVTGLYSLINNWSAYKAVLSAEKLYGYAALQGYLTYSSAKSLVSGEIGASVNDIHDASMIMDRNSSELANSENETVREIANLYISASDDYTDIVDMLKDPFEYAAGGELYSSRLAGNALHYSPETNDPISVLEMDVQLGDEANSSIFGEDAQYIDMLPIKY